MIDKEKIIVMTKLAIYERSFGEKDKEINNYFKHDYIYRKNTWTRFFVIIGGLSIILLRLLHKVFIEKIDLFLLDYAKETADAVFFIVSLIIIYTIIGSIVCSREYEIGKKRLARYQKLLRNLCMPTKSHADK